MFVIKKQASDIFSDVKSKPAGDKVLRRIVIATLMLCMALACPAEGMAKAQKKQGSSDNPKYASMIIDAETGAVVSERYPDKKVHPASLTKVMTLLLLFEALEAGNVRLNDKILISNHAASQQPSKLGLSPGSSIRVEDAILAIVTKSANDISTAVAEHLAGTESRFALRMTRRARDIGMSQTTFKNAHGLHNPGQITSARDMATLARYVLVRYPNYYRYFSTKQFTYRGKTYTNHNRLMNTYPGMDGFKTGFINASGFNLIASARHGNKRLIGVVFGGRSWKSRNDHMAELLNAGFSKVGDVRYAKAALVAVAQAPAAAPAPVPPPKPVFRTDLPPQPQQPIATAAINGASYTSLAALDQTRKVVVAPAAPAPNTLQLPPGHPQVDTTEQAIANVHSAINRGDYSELTGEGDYDAATTRRVETGLLAAAVYKGEHEKVKQMQTAMAEAGAIQPQQNPALTPVALPPVAAPAPAASDLWSVQIGAYNSRVATDDALRQAHTKLPGDLTHATPIVVPLKTAEGILFRARLGNLSKNQAVDACRYFRDCLPVAPR